MMRYSPHFLRSELRVTTTGLPNDPRPEHDRKLHVMCWAVLEPLRALAGPLQVTSGYRSAAVNRAVGGVPSSRHTFGDGVDVKAMHTSREVLWGHLRALIDEGLPVRQAIVYETSRHLHIEMLLSRPVDPAKQLLVKPKDRWDGRLYVPWSEYSDTHTLPTL